MALSLKEQYRQAEDFLNKHREEVSESLRLKLYGLSKQAKEGDCRMPKPPPSNTVLREKWDAWTACAGMPTEKALYGFITLVGKLQAQHDARNVITTEKAVAAAGITSPTKRTSIRLTDAVTGTVLKAGICYKQRDVFKGWRPRHFVLVDYFLQYYIEADDAMPRNTLDLTDCIVEPKESVIVEGVEYFPFIITHPTNSNSYKLSTRSQAETEEWIMKIKIAIGRAPSAADIAAAQEKAAAMRGVNLLDSSKAKEGGAGANDTESTDSDGILHSEQTLANIPREMSFKVEMAVQALIDATQPNSPGWEPMYEKKGVVASRRAGDNICVKGESVLPFHVQDVWDVLGNVDRQVEVDPQQRLHEVIKVLSTHSRVEYVRFKEVWPTSPRDFVMLVHWRLLSDNSLVLATFSEKEDELRPEYEGVVRGEIILAGYVLRPVPSGTQIHYVAQTDLKGKLPTSIVNMVCRDQPLVLATLKKLLDKAVTSGTPKRTLDAPVDYEALANVIRKGSPGGGGDSADGKPTVVVAAGAAPAGIPSRPKAPTPAVALDGKKAMRKPPQAKSWRNKMNEIAMLTLFMPVFAFYAVDGPLRSVVFLAALLLVFKYLVQLNIGSPIRKVSRRSELSAMPGGRVVMNVPVDLGALLRYLEGKRETTKLEVTISHVTVKACAMVVAEMPTLNGQIMGGNFYRARKPGVNVSLSLDVNELETGIMKVEDAAVKPVDYLSNEILTRTKEIRDRVQATKSGQTDAKTGIKTKILNALPPSISGFIEDFLYHLGVQYGIEIPALEVEAFPLGCCCVLTSPNVDGERDVEVGLVPESQNCSTPIVVTIGSLKLLTSMNADKTITGAPALNYTVSFDSKAGSMAEYRRFVTKLKKYLADPSLMDAVDEKAAYRREESKKRKEIFG